MAGFKRAGLRLIWVAALSIGAAGPDLSLSVAHAQAQASSERPVAKLRRMQVPLNSSQTIRLDIPFTDVLVGSSEIADVIPLSDQTLYVLGKKAGTTNISILDAQKRILAVVDVSVSVDTAPVNGAGGLSIRGQGDSVVVSGTALDATAVDRAVRAAQSIVGPDKVINNSQIASPQQVMLKVRFVEINRTAGRELGIRWDYLGRRTDAFIGRGGRDVDGNLLDTLISANAPFAHLLTRFASNSRLLDLHIDALEQKGLVRRLAEPNLVAMSGDTAEFHAGGEFPVPVASTTNGGVPTITVAFKEFGVRLNFTPTVLANGLINLKLEPEVSDIDPAISVNTGAGISIPGINKRRARTSIELRDGQSFALAGLLQSVNERNLEQLPWLGSIPVLGALFRSTEFRSRESELVVLVTPHLVKPAKPGALIATPLDTTVPANDLDLFLGGELEVEKPNDPSAVSARQKWILENGVKFKGQYGHILDPRPIGQPIAARPAATAPRAGGAKY
ncbi:type II and III secretion system protein family protein [Microvirga massiliensis]|uniref:type II and III secretion system protein family protein n=1 Tax=Microvirga massiliensis TaxID=1033741 RepID=UPI00062B9869|nr:type II and III secretion system protein family protein [Microvirga massiliensis]